MFNKYYNKSKLERIDILKEANYLTSQQANLLKYDQYDIKAIADKLVENQVSVFELPLGIATGFKINGQEYVIPMVSEEPSVIAAASYAANTIAKAGGFITSMEQKFLVGQIVFDEYDIHKVANISLDSLKQYAIDVYPSIINYGQGIHKLYFEEEHNFLTLYVVLDTGEAMGANMMNTILEKLATKICDEHNFRRLMAILSNYNDYSIVHAKFMIDPNILSKNEHDGYEISRKIISANEYAKGNVYRATTHNKGIMNGVTAVVLATGNDSRAIEASVHTYANQKPLTNYYFDQGLLVGEINIPLNLGTVGGCIKVHPLVQLVHDILKKPSAMQLAQIIACVGLAQNFAALRALVSTGIQAGHMKLHYKTLALECGALESQLQAVLTLFNQENIKNKATMQKIIQNLNKK